MDKKTTGLTTVFSLLLALTVGGILYHYLSGYNYPASPASDFEINVLGDPYELFFVVPLGLVGLWLMHKGKTLGTLLIAGVSVHFAYNYALFVTGQQNLWIFLWTAKLALSGVTLLLLWNLLPVGVGQRTRAATGIGVYLTFVLLVFSKMMGQRLLASATGQTMDMAMQGAGVLDWGEPFLRDPIVFFTFAAPLVVTAIIGLWRGTEWGGKAAALASAFIISIVTVVLFTGPLKEWLQLGTVSGAMWTMSLIMALAAAPAVWALVWLVRSAERTGSQSDRPPIAV